MTPICISGMPDFVCFVLSSLFLFLFLSHKNGWQLTCIAACDLVCSSTSFLKAFGDTSREIKRESSFKTILQRRLPSALQVVPSPCTELVGYTLTHRLVIHLYLTSPCFILFVLKRVLFSSSRKNPIAQSLVSPITIFTNLVILAVSYETNMPYCHDTFNPIPQGKWGEGTT